MSMSLLISPQQITEENGGKLKTAVVFTVISVSSFKFKQIWSNKLKT